MDFGQQFWVEEMEHVFSKSAPELTEDVETATQYLMDERGHPEANARQLAEVLFELDEEDTKTETMTETDTDETITEIKTLLNKIAKDYDHVDFDTPTADQEDVERDGEVWGSPFLFS